jgi:hypothetical protein
MALISRHFTKDFSLKTQDLGLLSPGIRMATLTGIIPTFMQTSSKKRSMVIGLAIDARKQRFSDETAYSYAPLAAEQDSLIWNSQSQAALKDYNLMDLSISGQIICPISSQHQRNAISLSL